MPYYHKLYAAKLYTSVLKKCSLVVKKSIFVILMIIVCNTNKKVSINACFYRANIPPLVSYR